MQIDLIRLREEEPSRRFVGVLLLFLCLAGSTATVYITGGTKYGYVQVMHLPIIIGGALYGKIGGMIVGIIAGFCVGPFMPLDSHAGLAQPMDGWLLRAVFFGMGGFIMGYLFDSLHAHVARTNRLADVVTLAYKNSLKTFAYAVEIRDQETAEHCERVAHNAFMVGHALRLSRLELDALYFGALLHDVGKIGVPDSILLKKGKLTTEEYALVTGHPTKGADLVLGISPRMVQIADAVESHHERWDGKGYPRGLAGKEIPLLGRIIKVVDEFEAMTSTRPYRQALPPGNVLGMMKMGAECVGHFDPDILLTFEDLYNNGRILVAGDPIPKGVFEPRSLDIYRSLIIHDSEEIVVGKD